MAAMLRAQTDLDGATLSLLRGVGPAHLRALRLAGVPNLEALAEAGTIQPRTVEAAS